MTKGELLMQVRAAHDKLLAVLDGLTEEEAERPGLNSQWSIKDALAHIVAWEEEGVRIAREAATDGGQNPRRLNKEQIDEFNARAVEERRSAPMREISDEFNEAHGSMLSLINSLPDEIDESSISYRYIYGVTIRHMAHHAAQIAEYRNSQKS
jgi:hypothetical protein